jgi:hypothetical protein
VDSFDLQGGIVVRRLLAGRFFPGLVDDSGLVDDRHEIAPRRLWSVTDRAVERSGVGPAASATCSVR